MRLRESETPPQTRSGGSDHLAVGPASILFAVCRFLKQNRESFL
jgi:hypothetical protein